MVELIGHITVSTMISPAFEALVESVSTLKFANRAKNIKNEAKVNEDLDQKSLVNVMAAPSIERSSQCAK